MLPRYRGVDGGTLVESLPVTVGGFTRDAGLFEAPLGDGARAILVDCPELFDREGLYGVGNNDYPDNARRYAFLARAALEFAGRRSPAPAVVHAHDWQAGLAPVYLRGMYRTHPVLGSVPSVFTIHNIAYQGLFDADWLPRLDLGSEQLSIDRLEYWGRISFLKGAINDADAITTVSPRYAQEIQTPELGFGFDQYGFASRYLEEDPMTQAVLATIVHGYHIVVCVSAGDGLRTFSPLPHRLAPAWRLAPRYCTGC